MADQEKKAEKTTEETTSLITEGKIYPDVQPGTVVRIHEEITDVNPRGEEKKRIQMFEGMVLKRNHGSGTNATITVRKVSNGVGVEKIFPLSMPAIKKIEVVRRYKVRRAKLSFLRDYFKRLKEIKNA